MTGWATLAILLAALAHSGPAFAGEAVVEAVSAKQGSGGTWRFDVTVRHADAGWDHYANAFVVTDENGTPLGTRTLLHPHDTEQPFTRSLTGVVIPAGADAVRVHAVDSVHGEGPAVTVALPR